jgi:hypothetical protein
MLRSCLVKNLMESGDDFGTMATTPQSSYIDETSVEKKGDRLLPPLPMPNLDGTLDELLASRKAVTKPEEVDEAFKAIKSFREIDGPILLKQLEESETTGGTRHDSYERKIYLSRRDPLQDRNTFFMGHPVEGAPVHSQAERAAIIALTVLNYKSNLESGSL